MYLGYVLLFASGLLLYVWLTLILLHHRVYEQFPVFFTYNVYAVFTGAARFIAFYIDGTYFYVYWWSELGFLMLSIAAIHEAFRSVFEGFYLLAWFRWVYFGGIAVVLISSVNYSIFNPPLEVHPLFGIVLGFGIPINCILAAIFALFYISTKALNVSFRRHAFAIALGFGISAVGTLIPYVVRSVFGKKMETFVIYAPSVAYYLALLVWLSAFYRQQSGGSEKAPALQPEQMAEEIRQYTRILKGFLGKSNAS
jgi:hypothetical protein